MQTNTSHIIPAGEFVTAGPVENIIPIVQQMEKLMKDASDAVKVIQPNAQRRSSRRASLIEPNVAPAEEH